MAKKRAYRSELRQVQAQTTKNSILKSAEELFRLFGFEGVTIDRLAEHAGVSASSIYALFQSKLGVLRALMYETFLPQQFDELVQQALLESSPEGRLAFSARIARHLIESEKKQQALFRGASLLHPDFKELEVERENLRYEALERTVEWLADEGALAKELTRIKARDILWMLTGRDIYRMLVLERGWSPDEYEEWVAEELRRALLKKPA
jgi:AcrR family transcriptional regulator